MTVSLRAIFLGWMFVPLAMAASVAIAQEAKPVRFYVAANGNDANAGTKEQPFATLRRVQQAVRQNIAAGTKGGVTVLIAAGTYELSETLVFGPEDSVGDHAVVNTTEPLASGSASRAGRL